MIGHLFKSIDRLFNPTNPTNKDRLDPISINKLKEVDASWSTNKIVIGWATDTSKQVLTLTLARK